LEHHNNQKIKEIMQKLDLAANILQTFENRYTHFRSYTLNN